MADTIKDYLIGFGFDVDKAGAGQVETMMKDMDTGAKNLVGALKQATEKVSGFISGVRDQSKTVDKSSESVKQYSEQTKQATKNTEQFGKALNTVKNTVKLIAGSAIVKGMFNIANSLYKSELALEDTAKKLKKTVDQTRAHEAAIKAIGKTYEEIKKNKTLKATYNDLVKIGEGMKLPDASKGMEKVREMTDAFARLKVIGQYALQNLFHAVLNLSEIPMRRLRDALTGLGDYLKGKMPKWTDGAAKVINNVLRIATAVGKAVGDIVKFLGDLPAPIKVILGLLTLLRIAMSPKGALAIAISGILLLLEDFYTYLEGGESLFDWKWLVDAWGKVQKAIGDAGEAIKGFWDASKGEDGKADLIEFGKNVLGWIIEGLASENLEKEFTGVATKLITGLGKAIGNAGTGAGEIIKGLSDMLGKALDSGQISRILGNLGDMGSQIVQAIGKGIKSAANGATTFIDAIGEMLRKALNPGANGGTLIGDLSGFGQSILTAIIGAIGDVVDGATQIMTAIGNLFVGIDWSKIGVDLGGFAAGIIHKLAEALGGGKNGIDFESIVQAIGNGLVNALSAAGDLLGGFIGKVMEYIFSGQAITDAFNIGINIFNLIMEGFRYGLWGIGKFIDGIFNGITDALGLTNPEEREMYEKIREEGKHIQNAVQEGFKDTVEGIDSIDLGGENRSLSEALIEALFSGGMDSMDSESRDRIYQLISEALEIDPTVAREALNSAMDNAISEMTDASNWGTLDAGRLKGILAENLGQYGFNADILTDAMYEQLANDYANGNDKDIMALLLGAFMSGLESSDTSELTEAVGEASKAAGEETAEAAKEGFEEGQKSAEEAAVEAAKNLGITSAEERNKAYEEGAESVGGPTVTLGDVTVTTGEGTGVQGATQEKIDNLIAEQSFSGNVTVKTSVTVEVEDSNAAEIGTTIGTEIGTNISTSIASSKPFSEMVSSAANAARQIDQQISSMVNRIKSNLRTISSTASSVGSSTATNLKNALNDLPSWVQTNIVDKINQSLRTIKPPTFKPSEVPLYKNSEGARVDHEIITRVGEEGRREYIIPVTKPDRGIPLLKQAAADLGLTVQSFADATRMLGGDATRNATPSYSATSNVSTINNYNTTTVSAPATINVRGSDPRSTANNVYANQEGLLLRNLKSALA